MLKVSSYTYIHKIFFYLNINIHVGVCFVCKHTFFPPAFCHYTWQYVKHMANINWKKPVQSAEYDRIRTLGEIFFPPDWKTEMLKLIILPPSPLPHPFKYVAINWQCYFLFVCFICLFFFPVFIFVSFKVKTQNVYLIFIMKDWGKSGAGGFWQ